MVTFNLRLFRTVVSGKLLRFESPTSWLWKSLSIFVFHVWSIRKPDCLEKQIQLFKYRNSERFQPIISPITNFSLLRKHPPPGNLPFEGQEEKRRSHSTEGGTYVNHPLSPFCFPPPQTSAACPHCQRHCLSVDYFFVCPLLLFL